MKNMTPIIPVSEANCQVISWKNLLKTAISDPFELLETLNLSSKSLDYPVTAQTRFSMRVPKPYIDKMKPGDPNDPLLLQVLTQAAENLDIQGYTEDPLKENANQTPGLLHKYYGRVLLILSSACAVNCRYCFRRHFPYQDQMANGTQLAKSLDYISNTQSISEVILSGGDPLMVSDSVLLELVKKLDNIPHVKRLRIHTRLPVVIPQRITPKLCQTLNLSRLDISMVLHINHANEIDPLLCQQLQLLKNKGVQLLNQSVLLKGVNDSAVSLIELSESLFSAGILPYYLHLLDKVAGAAHFDIPRSTATQIIEQVRKKLPGYLVPRLAVEIAGEASKKIIA
ncbi:EF-P beta-lysylation protein EpmB [Aliikangiella sp. IMCC44359]|uniref:EF-P beta-lysylation protein EpmB n=1 Tax=Aliikangiella sp. IMCC44359 TaxID=3459125 RepID=UPI00403AC4F5